MVATLARCLPLSQPLRRSVQCQQFGLLVAVYVKCDHRSALSLAPYPGIVPGALLEGFLSTLLLVVSWPVLAQSGMDADDLVPVGRLLVAVSGPHEERIVEKAPDELHADWKTS